MSHRLPSHGRLIDRSTRIGFTFNGKPLAGHPGDTLASALLANDQMMVGRSFKYTVVVGRCKWMGVDDNSVMSSGE